MSTSNEYTDLFKSNLSCMFLSARPKFKKQPFCPRTLCSIYLLTYSAVHCVKLKSSNKCFFLDEIKARLKNVLRWALFIKQNLKLGLFRIHEFLALIIIILNYSF